MAVFLAPGEVRLVDGRYECIEIIVDGILDGAVERLHLQCGRSGLHGNDIVPLSLRDGIGHHGVEGDGIAAEPLVSPLMSHSHLGGDDAHLGRVGSYHDIGDIL